MFYIIFSIIAAYLLGSVPTAYIFGKVLKGVDIRQYGSGNVGATNVVRTVGTVPGIIVLVLDCLKGVAAVTVIPMIFREFFSDAIEYSTLSYILLGSAAIAGHIWTIFLKFKGGKGIATTAGVMIGLSPGLFLLCLGVWIIIFSIWKYVSAASIIAAVTLPVFAAILGKTLDFIIFCGVLCLVGVYGHRDNIKRLMQGTETKIVKGQKR